jgi:hypothetical protein
MAGVPLVVVLFAHEVLFNASIVQRLEDGVSNLHEIHLVAETAFLGLHEPTGTQASPLTPHSSLFAINVTVIVPVFEDEAETVASVMPASFTHLSRKQAGHTLLGHAVHAVVVEDPHVPSKLHRVLGKLERERDAGDPHVILGNELDQDARDERVWAVVRLGERIILARIPVSRNS